MQNGGAKGGISFSSSKHMKLEEARTFLFHITLNYHALKTNIRK